MKRSTKDTWQGRFGAFLCQGCRAAFPLAALLASVAAYGITSSPVHIYVDPSQYYLWNTVTGSTVRLQWNRPPAADYADLLVEGYKLRLEQKKITDEWTDVTLPELTETKDEDVLRLTLSFNDGTQLSTTLGRVCGISSGGNAMQPVRCLMSTNGIPWQQSRRHYVITVPAGTETLTLDGDTVETGLDGFAGYYAAGQFPSATWHRFAIADDEVDIYSAPVGMSLTIR